LSDIASFDMSVRVHAQGATAAGALRAALADAARALADRGASAGSITAMRWTARQPAAIHPARQDIDLLQREVFGGLRPKIQVTAADQDGVTVEIGYAPTSAPATGPVWRSFTMVELAAAYSTRAVVRDMDGIFANWRHRGADFRRAHLAAELTYGSLHGEELDLYLPRAGSQPAPLWIFIHGGYWQAVDKGLNAHFAAGMLEAGFAVAMLNYTLAPEASLALIVQQVQSAVRFLAREAPALGCDASQLHIAGHSAGGHLAAMIASLPEGQAIRSCLPLSGIFDLEPLARLPMGRTLGLADADTIAQLSPETLDPLPHVRFGLAVGGLESGEFRRQSTDYAAKVGAPCRVIAGRHHFDLLDGLNGGELLDFARHIARVA